MASGKMLQDQLKALRECVTKNRVALVMDLNVDGLLLTFLQQQSLLTEYQIAIIRAEKTRFDKADKILDFIITKGPDFLDKFITALRETSQDQLADLLAITQNNSNQGVSGTASYAVYSMTEHYSKMSSPETTANTQESTRVESLTSDLQPSALTGSAVSSQGSSEPDAGESDLQPSVLTESAVSSRGSSVPDAGESAQNDSKKGVRSQETAAAVSGTASDAVPSMTEHFSKMSSSETTANTQESTRVESLTSEYVCKWFNATQTEVKKVITVKLNNVQKTYHSKIEQCAKDFCLKFFNY